MTEFGFRKSPCFYYTCEGVCDRVSLVKLQAFTVNDSEEVYGGVCFLSSGCDGSVFTYVQDSVTDTVMESVFSLRI